VAFKTSVRDIYSSRSSAWLAPIGSSCTKTPDLVGISMGLLGKDLDKVSSL